MASGQVLAEDEPPGGFGGEGGIPDSTTNRPYQTEDKEENPAPEEILVDAAFHFGSLEPRPETVEHRLCVLTCIDNQANNTACVLDNTSSQEKILQIHCQKPSSIQTESAMKGVNLAGGSFAIDDAVDALQGKWLLCGDPLHGIF